MSIPTFSQKAIQEGTVIVHCLAGVHRASAVTVSHYLYRHYALGHRHVCDDVPTLYENLAKIRRGVAPLGYKDMVDNYKLFLQSKYPSA